MKLIEAVEKVLREDPKTRDNKYLWLYVVKVLRELGFKVYLEFEKGLPSPDAMLTERRILLNKKNIFPEDHGAQEGVTYSKPSGVFTGYF